MSIQRKKGFTLIELMVVIVIIGILAAIAIPKLFGMSAKAKAAEVGPAAGTWSKLVSAYILETGEASTGGAEALNFKNIGYTPPGAAPGATSGSTNSFSYDENGSDETTGKWRAINIATLNDCKKDEGSWEATYPRSSQEPTGIVGGKGAADCKVLTPNFNLLK